MAVRKSGEDVVVKAVPFTGNDTDRWNAVAMAVMLLALAAAALLNLAFHAVRS
jgi:hypothetical protein